ncbi:hypothetical protein ACRE_037770 [Hapsidospora chrysogenum ATCC 11550]|uniref:DUF2293 domain-containing protein n=1 Tax=Hapsidospora chrysogenum (strain ATCC 11550 / CBS 779.69 / DSM 880 / IAM 14645 / JCM 23072 / IMI 49137) TaxID=857340 RepID=A0A086T7W5_HAPC1|nr:hypothetical protein ACRE_037770 [Hapsidospora chrysogenum ATCC 11550]
MGSHEPVVDVQARMPKGYGFLKKGNPYRTGLCRRLTHAEGKTLFVVTEKRKPIGLRAPKDILAAVFKEDRATSEKRRAAVEKRDEATQDEFRDEILKQFPRIPQDSVDKVLRHTLRKRSGRVGRTGRLDLEKKVRLAVTAHIRHCHTDYDAIMGRGKVSQRDGRLGIQDQLIHVMRAWGGEPPPPSWGRDGVKDVKGTKKKNNKRDQAEASGTKALPVRTLRTHQRAPKGTGKVEAPEVRASAKAIITPEPGKKQRQDMAQRPRTRSSYPAGHQRPLNMLNNFVNDKDNPIIIDSSSEDGGDGEESTDGEDIFAELDDDDLDWFIVGDTDAGEVEYIDEEED